VEEVEPGRRGVGEIGGAVEILAIIDRRLDEARQGARDARIMGHLRLYELLSANISLLIGLRKEFSDTESQRSDLSNVEVTRGEVDARTQQGG
jgi:hypothetical protein